jgi:hypothetical protein
MLGELFLRDALADPHWQARTLPEEVRLGRESHASLANEAMQLLFAPFISISIARRIRYITPVRYRLDHEAARSANCVPKSGAGAFK